MDEKCCAMEASKSVAILIFEQTLLPVENSFHNGNLDALRQGLEAFHMDYLHLQQH